jgi:HAMP domain-containing protein
MQNRGAAQWAAFWTVAVVLALLLFGGMSLLALRAVAPGGSLAALAPSTPSSAVTPGVTPGVTVSGADEPSESGQEVQAEGDGGDPAAAIGLWLSALSAITALVGLVSTLWLGWRKERREVAQHQVELEKLRLEVEKLRHELHATQGSGGGES